MNAPANAIEYRAVNAKLIELLRHGTIALGVFLSGFVVREPAPYELYMVALIAVWAFCGLRLSRTILPLITLLVIFNVGGVIAMSQLDELHGAPMYLAVSLFLAFTAIFFAAVTEDDPMLMRVAFRAWVIAAVATSIVGILGYFNAFPGAEMFTLYGRAAGAFQDPNVFGPFLLAPALYLIYRFATGPVTRMPIVAVPLLIITLGIFFSFSRGAWGLYALTTMMLVTFLLIENRSGLFRLRIIVMSLVALVLLIIAIVVALQIPDVAELFETRAQLVQTYDSARLGRFARHAIGFEMAAEHPLGIGALEFGRLLGEDTHNIWLKALLDYSWLGFAAYGVLIVWTLAAGFRILFRPRPWQPFVLCAWIALLGHTLLGTVIDTDHWRHFYVLLGLVWGGIALETRVQASAHAGTVSPVLRAA